MKLYSNFYEPNAFEIINDGWGKVIDPVVNVSLAEIETCSKSQEEGSIRNELFKPGSFVDQTTIKINDSLDRLQGKSALCATANINYFDLEHLEHSSKLKTILWLKQAGDSGIYPSLIPPTYRYSLFLDPNITSKTISLPISQSISPGDTDNFIIEVSSSSTAKFSLSFLFKSADEVELNSDSLMLDLFLPRSQVKSCGEDETISLLTEEIIDEIIYGRQRQESSNSSKIYGDTVRTNIHNQIYDKLRQEVEELSIHQISDKEKAKKYLGEYVRKYVHSRQIYLCAQAV